MRQVSGVLLKVVVPRSPQIDSRVATRSIHHRFARIRILPRAIRFSATAEAAASVADCSSRSERACPAFGSPHTFVAEHRFPLRGTASSNGARGASLRSSGGGDTGGRERTIESPCYRMRERISYSEGAFGRCHRPRFFTAIVTVSVSVAPLGSCTSSVISWTPRASLTVGFLPRAICRSPLRQV